MSSNTEVEIIECEVVDNKLEEAMHAKGLSQEKTARRARMTTRQLCRIMQQQNCPSLKRAMALSIVLERPMEDLFKFRVKKRKALDESTEKKAA